MEMASWSIIGAASYQPGEHGKRMKRGAFYYANNEHNSCQAPRLALRALAQQEFAALLDHRLTAIGDDIGGRVGLRPQLPQVRGGARHVGWRTRHPPYSGICGGGAGAN